MKTRITDKIIAALIIFVGLLTIIISGAATWNNFSGHYNSLIEEEASSYIYPINTTTTFKSEDTIIEFDGNRIITLHKNQQGDQEKMELIIENGKIIELRINEKTVPEEDYPEYFIFVERAFDEVKNASTEVIKAEQNISASMKEAMEALQTIDWDHIQENVSSGLEDAMLNIESIDFDSLLESLNITLDLSGDALNEISISIEQALKDINTADIARKMDSAKTGINKDKEKLQELEKNMEKALEDLEKE